MKLNFTAFVKKNGTKIVSEDIARLNFNNGVLYALLTWDEEMYFPEHLDIIEMNFS